MLHNQQENHTADMITWLTPSSSLGSVTAVFYTQLFFLNIKAVCVHTFISCVILIKEVCKVRTNALFRLGTNSLTARWETNDFERAEMIVLVPLCINTCSIPYVALLLRCWRPSVWPHHVKQCVSADFAVMTDGAFSRVILSIPSWSSCDGRWTLLIYCSR